MTGRCHSFVYSHPGIYCDSRALDNRPILTVLGGRAQHGSALVELAVVLPVFLALTFGITVFGIGFVTQQAVAHAAERGAEAAVVVNPGAEDFYVRARQLAEGRIAQILGYFPGVSSGTFELTDAGCTADEADAEKNAGSSFCVTESDTDPGRRVVTVRLAPTFQSLWPGFPVLPFLPGVETIRATGVSVMDRPGQVNVEK